MCLLGFQYMKQEWKLDRGHLGKKKNTKVFRSQSWTLQVKIFPIFPLKHVRPEFLKEEATASTTDM